MLSYSSLGQMMAHEVQREFQRACLALLDSKDRHKGIHQARKAIRRVRSLLRLAEPALEAAADDIDIRLRRSVRSLRALRDSHAALAVAQRVFECETDGIWLTVVPLLTERRDGLLTKALQKDPRFRRRRRDLGALAERLALMDWDDVTDDAIAQGLVRSELEERCAWAKALSDATLVGLGIWRRRVRRLQTQLKFAQRAQTHGLLLAYGRHPESLIRRLSAQSSQIGAIRDLRTLRRVLNRELDSEKVIQVRPILHAHEAPHYEALLRKHGAMLACAPGVGRN